MKFSAFRLNMRHHTAPLDGLSADAGPACRPSGRFNTSSCPLQFITGYPSLLEANHVLCA
jgi:hypothetical protein